MQEKVSLFLGRGKSFESINVKLFQREEREVRDERRFFRVWVDTANQQIWKEIFNSLTLSFNSVLFPRQKIPALMNTLNTTNATEARR